MKNLKDIIIEKLNISKDMKIFNSWDKEPSETKAKYDSLFKILEFIKDKINFDSIATHKQNISQTSIYCFSSSLTIKDMEDLEKYILENKILDSAQYIFLAPMSNRRSLSIYEDPRKGDVMLRIIKTPSDKTANIMLYDCAIEFFDKYYKYYI
jgi:hypothetical protein